jgi:hypothetical protein
VCAVASASELESSSGTRQGRRRTRIHRGPPPLNPVNERYAQHNYQDGGNELWQLLTAMDRTLWVLGLVTFSCRDK